MRSFLAACTVFAVALAARPASALVWSQPAWLPEGTEELLIIEDGESAEAGSGSFFSIDTVVQLRVNLWSNDCEDLVTLLDTDVDLSTYNGFESVTIGPEDYSGPGDYLVEFVIADSRWLEVDSLRLRVSPEPSTPPEYAHGRHCTQEEDLIQPCDCGCAAAPGSPAEGWPPVLVLAAMLACALARRRRV
jgi:MYXO-CTERM domain-containing protein